MPIGADARYDQSWSEIDKIKRRLELRYRLKEEGIRKRYDPFLQLSNTRFSDPAVDRYADLRKRGRLPGAPVRPTIFYTLAALIASPVYLFYKILDWRVKPRWEAMKSGDIPYEMRKTKAIG